ncbi:MAG: SDR family oxidoreductase [Deltaproteobacteria bacterium]|nr:SDR family oxidoreductase [Myxococcales bacterium]MDP3214997.1 SDR family oxidoreductase [Deltaproteobacteria bacterium]
MRYFVLGATGKTGTQLLDLALQNGHHVTAFVRSPQKLPKDRPGLTVIQGSPSDVPAMARAMVGHDAVFSALAPSMGETLSAPSKRSWTMAGHAANIVQAMQQAGVKRLLAFSSAGLFPGQSLFVRMLSFPARHHMADLKAMEEAYQVSDLEWTLLRPTWMTAGDSDAYRVTAGALPEGSKAMHFRGLARFMLDAAAEGSHRREVLGIGR